MTLEQKIKELEDRISHLETNNKIMENILISKVPDWAIEPLSKIKEKGEIPYPYIKDGTYGSYDYYRIIALLINKEII